MVLLVKRTRTKFIETATQQVGYRAGPLKQTAFRANAGDWDGAFVGWAARTTGFYVPDFTSTTAALSKYIADKRLFRNPQIGDIVFFAFAYDGGPGAPHVGIVSDIEHWRDGWFRDIEGQTASGRPREPGDLTGVFERVRFRYDVIGFARPTFTPIPASAVAKRDLPLVAPSSFLTSPNNAIVVVQEALRLTVGLTKPRRGVWNAMSRSAYAAWQRLAGFPATGTPTFDDLTALSRRTGLFETRP